MKAYICFTGWEEGTTVHKGYFDKGSAEAWVQTYNQIVLPKKEEMVTNLRRIERRLFEEYEDGSISKFMENPEYKKADEELESYCKEFCIDSIDHHAWWEEVKIE